MTANDMLLTFSVIIFSIEVHFSLDIYHPNMDLLGKMQFRNICGHYLRPIQIGCVYCIRWFLNGFDPGIRLCFFAHVLEPSAKLCMIYD